APGLRPHERLQVLPPRGATPARPLASPGPGLRLPGRDELALPPGRLAVGRGADHVRGPQARPIEDVTPDLLGSNLARLAAPASGLPSCLPLPCQVAGEPFAGPARH